MLRRGFGLFFCVPACFVYVSDAAVDCSLPSRVLSFCLCHTGQATVYKSFIGSFETPSVWGDPMGGDQWKELSGEPTRNPLALRQ